MQVQTINASMPARQANFGGAGRAANMAIAGLFTAASAAGAHATAPMGKAASKALPGIESQAFLASNISKDGKVVSNFRPSEIQPAKTAELNAKAPVKALSNYYGIPREEIQRIYTFQGTNNRSYDLIYAYRNNKKNPGTNYVDDIYIAPKLMDEVKDDAFRIEGISVIKEADGSQTLAFNVCGYKAYVDPDTHMAEKMQVTGLFVPPKSVGEEILFLVANSQRNSTGYAFLNGAPLIKNMESIDRSNATLESRIIKAF